MTNAPNPAPQFTWNEPGRLREVQAWAGRHLRAQALPPGGPLQPVHERPWSRVLRAPTPRGAVYLKATAPVFGHEPGLTAALSRWNPGRLPEVIAHDAARGWTLMMDAGVPLRAAFSGEELLARWERALPQYAELQRDAANHVGELLTLGTPNRRLAGVPALLGALLEDPEALLLGQPNGLTPEEHARARSRLPAFAETCAELAALGVPETLHHDDFHDGNVFVQGGEVRFADWAESAVTHPFCTLTVGLRGIAYRAGLPEDAPRLARLVDAYLEPWTEYGPLRDLRAAAALARRVGRVVRARTWYALVSSLSAEARAEEEDAVPGWVQVWLEGEPARA